MGFRGTHTFCVEKESLLFNVNNVNNFIALTNNLPNCEIPLTTLIGNISFGSGKPDL